MWTILFQAIQPSRAVSRVFATLAVLAFAARLWAQVPDFTPPTALIGALMHNDTAEAKRLLDQGADPNQGRFVGFPPLFLAVMRQHVELVSAMVAKGADLNARDGSGSTALMWAAFNDGGDAALVKELLKLGCDPHATNKSGETAMTWALRRGETPVVSVLRNVHASDSALIKAAAEKAIGLLQRSGSQFVRVSGCVSCHHQSVPQLALGAARTRGLIIDEAAARQQLEAVVAVFKPVQEAILHNRDRIPDPPISASYALLGLAAGNYPADSLTSAMASLIAAWQSSDGAFYPLPPLRPPIEGSDFTATALSLRALQLYGKDASDRVARAREWLRTSKPRNNEDRAMQLLGLAWAKAPAVDLDASAKKLIAEQRPDGGWAQLPALESDAYATGQALVALHEARMLDAGSAEYRRGIGFLLRTQFGDGSWLVRSRTFPVQPYKESGFPHGKDQWISATGTAWAAMALSLELPEEPVQAR